MANKKYDNLVPLMATGGLAWNRDRIMAVLLTGAVYNATQQRLRDVVGVEHSRAVLPSRSVGPTGSFLGSPVAFNAVAAATPYAVILVKDDGSGNPWLISFYDSDDSPNGGLPIQITNSGSLVVRPSGSVNDTPGTWVTFAA